MIIADSVFRELRYAQEIAERHRAQVDEALRRIARVEGIRQAQLDAAMNQMALADRHLLRHLPDLDAVAARVARMMDAAMSSLRRINLAPLTIPRGVPTGSPPNISMPLTPPSHHCDGCQCFEDDAPSPRRRRIGFHFTRRLGAF